MSKEEIEAKIQAIGEQLAELSMEVLKENDSAASLVELSVVNVMGKCQVAMNIQTSGNKKEMERVGRVIERVVKELDKEDAEKAQEETAAKEPVDVDLLLKDILSKRKMKD